MNKEKGIYELLPSEPVDVAAMLIKATIVTDAPVFAPLFPMLEGKMVAIPKYDPVQLQEIAEHLGVYALEAVDKLKAIPTTITTQIAPKILEVITTKLWPAATAFAGSIGTWITGTFAPAMATAFSTLGSVLFSPIGLAVIGAVVGGFLLWQNWDTVTEFAGKAKEAIENLLQMEKMQLSSLLTMRKNGRLS